MPDDRSMTETTEAAAAKPSKEENGKKRKLSPRARRILLILGCVVGVAAVGWFVDYEIAGKYRQSTDDAYVQADMVAVAPRVSGYVDAVVVIDNQEVKTGDALVRIDPRDYRAQVAQYTAQVDVSRANADNARASIFEQEAAIAMAEAQLASAESDEKFAAAQVTRYEPLARSGAETTEKLTSLRDTAAKSGASVAAQRASLLQAQRRIASLTAQLHQAEAQGEVAQAQLDAAKVNLDATTIAASIDGRVGDKSVQLGQYVQAGTRMMSIVPVQHPYVTANFKETQIGLMRPGQPATISVDALPGVALKGHVDSIAPGTGSQFSILPPQNATGNFTKIVQRVPVRISIDPDADARAVLVPGLSVVAEVDTSGTPVSATTQGRANAAAPR
jgi:membrane fusion protein, multidrug efflux system